MAGHLKINTWYGYCPLAFYPFCPEVVISSLPCSEAVVSLPHCPKVVIWLLLRQSLSHPILWAPGLGSPVWGHWGSPIPPRWSWCPCRWPLVTSSLTIQFVLIIATAGTNMTSIFHGSRGTSESLLVTGAPADMQSTDKTRRWHHLPDNLWLVGGQRGFWLDGSHPLFLSLRSPNESSSWTLTMGPSFHASW